MACMTLLVPPVTMTTTQFARSIRYEVSASRQQQHTERQPLRMNWGRGHRQAQQPQAPHAAGGCRALLRVPSSACNTPLTNPK
jgi:hypothetical protein